MQSARHPKLRFESLENRLLMANNVTAIQTGGDLFVQGDDANNDIIILGTGVPGQVVVEADPFGLTTINGVAGGVQTFRGVTGDINIKLTGGGDFLQVDNLATSRDLNIDMGTGLPNDMPGTNSNNIELGDSPHVGSVGIGRDLNATGVSLGIGFNRVFAQRDFNVTTGDGPDAVEFSTASCRDVNVHTGAGYDIIGSNNLTVRRNMLIDTGTDPDLISMIQTAVYGDATLQHGKTGLAKYVLQADSFSNAFNVNLGNDTNELDLTGCIIGGTTNFHGGNSFDTVKFDNVVGADFNIDTGDGNDEVVVQSSRVNNLSITADNGNDGVEIIASVINGKAFADGGSGSDLLDVSGNIGTVKNANFETFA